MAAQTIAFDGHSLQTNKIITQTIDHESIPTKTANIYALAHASGSKIPFVSYPSKTITVTGVIYETDSETLDETLDEFRGWFNTTDSYLDIGYRSGTRRYIATVNSLMIDRPGGLTSANFTIQFITTQPFGQNTDIMNIISETGRTSSSYTDIFTISGSAPWQRPIVSIVYTTASGTGTVRFGNTANGQTLTISGTRSAGDILTFNSMTKTVQVNYEDIDFTGAFPEFPAGLQSASYSDGLTSRTFNYSIDYYPMWL